MGAWVLLLIWAGNTASSGGEGRVLRMAAVSQKRVLRCDKRRVSKYYYPGEHNWRRIRTRGKVRTQATVRKDKVEGL